jgi:two-component system LytT family response regulator
VVLSPQDIDWIGANDYYVDVHSAGRRYLLRESLHSLAARLRSVDFVQVHRQAVVNLDRVREFRRSSFGGCLVLENGTKIPVSRRRRDAVRRALRGLEDPITGA